MSLYHNETSKIYSDLNSATPKEAQIFPLKTLTEFEGEALMKLKFLKGWPKKIKRFNAIASVLETGLITSTVITVAVSIAVFAIGAGWPVVIE